MKKQRAVIAGALAMALHGASFAADTPAKAAKPEGLPLWAWGVTTPPPNNLPGEIAPAGAPGSPTAPRAAVTETPKVSIEGAIAQFSRSQVNNAFGPADWFPGDHPPMPRIVSHGREDANIFACALCHMPNGKGRPENANVIGLPYDYFMRQMLDFAAGHRKTSDSRKTNTGLMIHFAQQMTREEMEEAARYFTSIPSTPWIKVVEGDTVPKTEARGGVFHTIVGEKAGTEPIGNRIIETPISSEQFELRNPRVGFIAYVPTGSLKKGEALVTTGGGKVTACTVCHGADLRGLGPVPTIAGCSPSYVGRQLYDMKVGNRIGPWMPMMAPVVSQLTNDDILIISAYLASLDP